jgi:hypothetical protein
VSGKKRLESDEYFNLFVSLEYNTFNKLSKFTIGVLYHGSTILSHNMINARHSNNTLMKFWIKIYIVV